METFCIGVIPIMSLTRAWPDSWNETIFFSLSINEELLDSSPAITLSRALSKCREVICSLFSLTANIAASLAIFDQWAPLKPCVFLAKVSRFTDLSIGLLSVCTFNISNLV